MLLLLRNIFSDLSEIGLAYRSDEIVILPRKSRGSELVLVDPVRRFPFYQFHDLFDRLIAAERDQAVNVIQPSIDEINMNVLSPSVLPDVVQNSQSYLVG